MSFYEKGAVRIYFEEAGSGFPLLVIPGGGLNSTIAGLEGSSSPFNPMEEFKGEYRCIASDLRNANGGQSTGPLEIDRPWDAYADDQLGVMDPARPRCSKSRLARRAATPGSADDSKHSLCILSKREACLPKLAEKLF